jgi:Rod binding domain-containing protein
MKTEATSFIDIARSNMNGQRMEELRQEQAATDFEEIFARHLVKEMTKGSFEMSDNNGMMGQSKNLYREFITDALAGELAAQRRIGIAELVSRYWDSSPKIVNERLNHKE